jgi:hypothetical protein
LLPPPSDNLRVYFLLQYKATGGSDWYEAAIVLYEGIPPANLNTNIVDARVVRGSYISDFKTEYFTIPADGTYFLGFFTASYDASGGGALGANMQVLAFSYTGGAKPLTGGPTSAPTESPDPDFEIPAFCDQFIARRRLDGEKSPLPPSQHYFEERPRRLAGEKSPLPSQHYFEERPGRGLQAGIEVAGAGIATLRFPNSRRRLGTPDDAQERDLQENPSGGSEINLQFTVMLSDGDSGSSASINTCTTSLLFAMGLFLAGALLLHM